jgi:NAD kinase
VKKITKKERRRRQNCHLRRLITPKNALMALNEMVLKEQISNVSHSFHFCSMEYF